MRLLPFGLQPLGGLDPLPGGRDADQHLVPFHAALLVQSEQGLGARDDGVGVAGDPRVDLGGDCPGDALGEEGADVGQGRVDAVGLGGRVREGALDGDL